MYHSRLIALQKLTRLQLFITLRVLSLYSLCEDLARFLSYICKRIAVEVCFHYHWFVSLFVGLFVYLSGSNFTQKVLNGFW